MLGYGRQHITDADVEAVVEVLRSDFLTQGPALERFESAVSAYCGVNHAVAVCNATCALHLACRALGLGPGDTLWTSPNTFVASANCALYCGASADFVDIDPATLNMSVEALEAKLRAAEREGKLPKVVVPVHFGGQSCDMEKIHALGERYGFRILEDASHAIGGRYKDTKVGSCRYSDITVFSFHPVKIITTGEGGLLTTQSGELAAELRLLRTHGITRDAAKMKSQPHGPWYYEQVELGYNYRMTDIQAALGLSQMRRLDEFVSRRNELAKRYDRAFQGMPVGTQVIRPEAHSAYHLYVIRVREGARKRAEVVRALREKGIALHVHYIPVHRQPYYEQLGFRKGDFPEAERYYAEAATLPLFFALAEAEQDGVVDALREALGNGR